MLQSAPTQKVASQILQKRPNQLVERTKLLNIRFTLKKCEIMHIITHFKALQGTDDKGINLYDTSGTPKNCIKSLGIWIDHRMSFKIHAAAADSKVRQQFAQLWRVTKRKGAFPAALRHFATTATLPGLMWGSEVCWTGARHINDQLAPAYNTVGQIIIGLPAWTPRQFFLAEAGLLP